ncbi:hypothetical protein ACLOJK_012563 [Asimina triloba]
MAFNFQRKSWPASGPPADRKQSTCRCPKGHMTEKKIRYFRQVRQSRFCGTHRSQMFVSANHPSEIHKYIMQVIEMSQLGDIPAIQLSGSHPKILSESNNKAADRSLLFLKPTAAR